MRLIVLVLNDVDKLETLMRRFKESGIGGATIIQSTGMIQALASLGDESLIGSLRHILDMDRQENRTLFMVTNEDKVQKVIEVIESVTGDLNTHNTGVVFTLPIDFAKGIFGLETK